MFGTLLAVVNGLGLMALLTIAYGWLNRRLDTRAVHSYAVGALFGLGAAFAMHGMMLENDGYRFDIRCVIVALAACFCGWRAGLVAAAIAILVRWEIGGVGMPLGVAAIAASVLAGLVWRLVPRARGAEAMMSYAALGCLAATPVLMLAFLPGTERWSMIATLGVWGSVSAVSAAMFGPMLQREDERRAGEDALKVVALTDPLTGLGNRRAFEAVLGAELSAPQGRPHALLLVDADHFKRVNDRFGHETGDRLLQVLAVVLRQNIRASDYAFRLGGEEFAIVLPETARSDAVRVAERIRQATEAACRRMGDRPLAMTLSLGVAVSGFDRQSAHRLYVDADAALYAAKAGGRNRVCVAGNDEEPGEPGIVAAAEPCLLTA